MSSTVVIPVGRSFALDRLRGVAIVLMVTDHLLELTHSGDFLRLTLTRFSMPLFFLISGHLLRRFSKRTVGIGFIGIVLPLVIPWIDAPNVLLMYALGAFLLTRFSALPVAVVGLTIAANHFDLIGNAYGFGAILAIMALGKMTPRSTFDWANKLPNVLTVIGRYPLSVYVGHLLILQGIVSL